MSPLTTLLAYGVLMLFSLTSQIDSVSLATPTTILAAEQEGRVYPHADPQPPSTLLRVDEIIGSTERKCVEIAAGTKPASPVSYRKSGEFAVGGEIRILRAGHEAKVPWMPFHDPGRIHASLLVRAVRLDEPGTTLTFASSFYALSELGPPVVAFYPSGFMLPSAGRWVLIATAGNDWGCFIVTVN